LREKKNNKRDNQGVQANERKQIDTTTRQGAAGVVKEGGGGWDVLSGQKEKSKQKTPCNRALAPPHRMSDLKLPA